MKKNLMMAIVVLISGVNALANEGMSRSKQCEEKLVQESAQRILLKHKQEIYDLTTDSTGRFAGKVIDHKDNFFEVRIVGRARSAINASEPGALLLFGVQYLQLGNNLSCDDGNYKVVGQWWHPAQ
ncbi:MAG TPA: hypothetical protein VN132_01565 [Bdellovibrio sp.]|nr:hypothetical protein [Bdellovibrio sp.]